MSIDKKRIGKILKVTAIGTGVTFLGLNMIAKKKKGDSVFEKEKDQKNPFAGKKVVFVEDESDEENADGVRGHLEAVGETKKSKGIYDRYIKRAIDVVLSFGGLVVLSPIYAGIAIAIKIDDPGPVFFTQKRVGQNKEFFKIHKFRSMKMSTPHDVPTHMLGDPDQYITRVGKFLRKHSLDELPQIWDIFIGNMSVIGPRPALWNQDVLIAEREKYHANDVKPGLTGWAQINGRDELEIPVKAKLDGEYVEKESLLFDIKCFFFTSVGHPFPAVCIRTSTERPEALDKGCFVLAGIDSNSLVQAVETAVAMNENGDYGIPVPDYVEENVSTKVVKIIQSYTGVVNKMVWRKF